MHNDKQQYLIIIQVPSHHKDIALPRFLHIVAISRQKEARNRNYVLLLSNDFRVIHNSQ